MCLIVDEIAFSAPKIADHDIVCYKVVRVNVNCSLTDEVTRSTPFMNTDIPANVISGEKNFIAESDECDGVKSGNLFYGIVSFVDSGFIHTYADLYGVKTFVYGVVSCSHINLEVYKCVIPAGTPYYVGMDYRDRIDAYASKEIKFVERVDRII